MKFSVANPGFPRFGCANPRDGGKNLLLPPANEVCEGYVFTPVCQSFCSQGVPARGGGLVPRGSGPGGSGDPPRDGYCCGRYASYWNVFLFGKTFAENGMKMKEIIPRGGARP